METIERHAIVSGGFDPLHSGHIALINGASKYGEVHVLLNSDQWLRRKKGFCFMPFEHRKAVLLALPEVAAVHEFNDDDGTATNGIEDLLIAAAIDKKTVEFTFCNGGDRQSNNVPETAFCDLYGIRVAYGIGGNEKLASSSDFLGFERKPWGWQLTIDENDFYKVRLLWLDPGQRFSLQWHKYRAEHWLVLDGGGTAMKNDVTVTLQPKMRVWINERTRHRVTAGDKGILILETQFGECSDLDIYRLEDDYGRIGK